MRSKIASKIYNETPESTKQKVKGMANAIVYDANTFGPDEVPVEYENGQSNNVLIDTTGERKHYFIGWYDHRYSNWYLESECQLVTSDHIRWSFLPLAIYDTNPELRKTVKI